MGKITINAIILGGSYDIDRKNIDKLINLRSYYKITGKHPGYRKFERREKVSRRTNKETPYAEEHSAYP